MTNYSVCDFCHTAKPEKEIENVVVVYKKCRDCVVEITVGKQKSVQELYPMLDMPRTPIQPTMTVPVQPMETPVGMPPMVFGQPVPMPIPHLPPLDPTKPAANPLERPPRDLAGVFGPPPVV